MADSDTDGVNTGRPAWARGGFDIEGWVAAVAAIVVGFLLGSLWSPLFIFGGVGAVIALAATRYARRTPPDEADVVLSPVDGVVHSIEATAVPQDLRLRADTALRIRISSSPASTNLVYAPVTGSVESLVHAPGNQTKVLASDPDDPELECASVTIKSGEVELGLAVIVGAFGPRLEMSVEAGDNVRSGRACGKRRLGGWCDIYLPVGTRTRVWPGQTLVGAETVLADLVAKDGFEAVTDEPADVEIRSVDDPDEATAEMFAKLRREVEKADKDAE